MDTLQLPTRLGVIKVKAYTKGDTPKAWGNARAYAAAKAAAKWPTGKDTVSIQAVSLADPITPDVLKSLQNEASTGEKEWGKHRAQLTEGGLWYAGSKLCLPRVLYPTMAQVAHRLTHQSKTAMCSLVDRHWVAPGFSTAAARFTQVCMICAKHNTGKVVKVPQKHTLRPLYLFQRLQIDYKQLPKVGAYEFVLVCVDLFSGWPEAFPVSKATTKATAQKLMKEVICRFGVPETTGSDR
ncbi:Integrase core domain, partial [Pristimantis euphronides]